MSRTYIGYLPLGPVDWRVAVVTAGRRSALLPRLDVANHSPAGFSWGYGGSGAAQLALAILCDAIGPERALPLYQAFKRQNIETRDQHAGWEMTLSDVLAWVKQNEDAPA